MESLIVTTTTPARFSALLALALCAACSGKPASTAIANASTSTAASASTPPASESRAAQSPHAAPSDARADTVTGTVLETMDASNYTYIKAKVDSKEVWLAASQVDVAVGDRVTFALDQPMQNFHSPALNRDFPLIYFVSALGRVGDNTAPAMAIAHRGGSVPETPAAAPPSAPIAPPAGGSTIANVWKTRTALAGKTVTVRGKVVKYNGGILGVNWIHLQDGSGTAADGTNDITVTSETDTKVGDIITATGVVALDKDLGSGYNYPVIIEHATIKP
jgi:hypothetical protein